MRPSASAARRLVLVTGVARSGTSTMAGTLHHLGLHIPLPVLKPNPSNPQGFFESTWPVQFHRRLLDAAYVSQTDSRPEAFDRMARAVTDDDRARLRRWLGRELDTTDQVVVKDPRAVWLTALWADTAADLGAELGFLVMIRHPAEVVASRATYYGRGRAGEAAWLYAVGNVCAWLNGNLGLERRTRDRRRVIVNYEQLVADWRAVARTVRDTFDLRLELDGNLEREQRSTTGGGVGVPPGAPGAGGRHPVDAFIDPGLRRHPPSWERHDVPAELVTLADATWAALCDVAGDAAPAPGAAAELDALAERYAQLVRLSQAVARDTTIARVRVVRAQARSAGRWTGLRPMAARLGSTVGQLWSGLQLRGRLALRRGRTRVQR